MSNVFPFVLLFNASPITFDSYLKLPFVADHFYYSCLLGLLASVTDGSWHAL